MKTNRTNRTINTQEHHFLIKSLKIIELKMLYDILFYKFLKYFIFLFVINDLISKGKFTNHIFLNLFKKYTCLKYYVSFFCLKKKRKKSYVTLSFPDIDKKKILRGNQ